MRITTPIAVAAAAFLVAGLTACSAEQKTIELEVVEAPQTEVEETTETTWTADELAADLIEDFPEDETAALTALSERLDAAAPSSKGVGVRVSIFEEGKVVVRVIVDKGANISAAELKAIIAELKAFTGSPVTDWLVETKDVEDFYVDMDELAAEAGLPAEWDGGWGDLEIPADQLASFA